MKNGLHESHRFDDIIRLPHHVSPKHPQMSRQDRAAQFAPFAALSGHSSALSETARVTRPRMELGEDRKDELDHKLALLAKLLPRRPEVRLVYFLPDAKKEGGMYRSVVGVVERIDAAARRIVLETGAAVAIDDLVEMEFSEDFFT